MQPAFKNALHVFSACDVMKHQSLCFVRIVVMSMIMMSMFGDMTKSTSLTNIIDKHHWQLYHMLTLLTNIMSWLWCHCFGRLTKSTYKILQNFTKFYAILRRHIFVLFVLCWTQCLMHCDFFLHDAKHTDITLILRVTDGCNSQVVWWIDDELLFSCKRTHKGVLSLNHDMPSSTHKMGVQVYLWCKHPVDHCSKILHINPKP